VAQARLASMLKGKGAKDHRENATTQTIYRLPRGMARRTRLRACRRHLVGLGRTIRSQTPDNIWPVPMLGWEMVYDCSGRAGDFGWSVWKF
jgi:hypothetical protein